MSSIDFIFQGAPTTSGAGAIPTPGTKLAPSIGLDVVNGVGYLSAGAGWVPQVPATVAKFDAVAQSAAIAATTLYAVPSHLAGQYRVSFDAKVTTVDGTSSTLGPFQIKYTDIDTIVVQTPPGVANVTQNALNTTQAAISGSLVANCTASTNLQFVMGYTSNTPGQMIYNLHIRVDYLG